MSANSCLDIPDPERAAEGSGNHVHTVEFERNDVKVEIQRANALTRQSIPDFDSIVEVARMMKNFLQWKMEGKFVPSVENHLETIVI